MKHSGSPQRPKGANNAPGRAELIETHIECANRIAIKLLRCWGSRIHADERRSLVGLALCRAAASYDGGNQVRFSTYLFAFIRGTLIQHIHREARHRVHVLAADSIGDAPMIAPTAKAQAFEGHSSVELHERLGDLKKLLLALSPLEALVLRTVCRGGSVSDLARSTGYSRGHLARVKSATIRKLRTELA